MAEQSMRDRVADAMIGSDALQPDLRTEASIVGSSQREPFLMFADAILPLIEEAVAAERERCAGVALDMARDSHWNTGSSNAAHLIAAAIRGDREPEPATEEGSNRG